MIAAVAVPGVFMGCRTPDFVVEFNVNMGFGVGRDAPSKR